MLSADWLGIPKKPLPKLNEVLWQDVEAPPFRDEAHLEEHRQGLMAQRDATIDAGVGALPSGICHERGCAVLTSGRWCPKHALPLKIAPTREEEPMGRPTNVTTEGLAAALPATTGELAAKFKASPLTIKKGLRAIGATQSNQQAPWTLAPGTVGEDGVTHQPPARALRAAGPRWSEFSDAELRGAARELSRRLASHAAALRAASEAA